MEMENGRMIGKHVDAHVEEKHKVDVLSFSSIVIF